MSSPVVDEYGVLKEPVEHADLEVNGLTLHPHRHVDGITQRFYVDLNVSMPKRIILS